jgi:ketosteroid isomerase-like protein
MCSIHRQFFINMRQFFISLILICLSFNSFAQLSNGKVNSLVAAEDYFSAFTKKNGSKAAFLKVSDDETIIFRPEPVKVKDFYNRGTIDAPGQLSWETVFAKVSRSGDWGFSTGPYTYIGEDVSSPSYGQYLSVWKTNSKGVWKLALDLAIAHAKPSISPELDFTDAKNLKFFRQLSHSRLKQREEMITTTDKLFSKTLLDDQSLAHDIFLADSARLLFPGEEPIIGKARIHYFLDKNQISIESEPVLADRSLGSDLAYSYGTAFITRGKQISKYHYIRIWESQVGYKWNVILEAFTPAKED